MVTITSWRRKMGMLAVAAMSVWPNASDADCRAASPDHSIALIELYTSEGCDSCPPADRWLSRIDDRQQATRVVALALHVDYWDRLGWKDRFANAAFTERQYEQMRRQRASFVYTPQIMVQGRDFPQWRTGGDPTAAIAAINARPARATIELVAEPQGSNASVDLHVRVPNARDREHALIVVALVQSGLVSDVKAGENAGKRLAHDHVVRQWRVAPALDATGEARERLTFALPAERGPLTIVAFAEDTISGDVLQALALPFCARS
jgi:hypothetical protein